MYTKYSRPISIGRHSGFPHKSGWDDVLELLAPLGQVTWFREITEDLGGGKVRVKDFGEMLMLSGYSYLGLNKHPAIREAAINAFDKFGSGTSGSRWLAGHTNLHEELETLLAEIHGTEDAVAFSSGYVTNVSTIDALVGRNDLVLSDKLNHASIIDGCRYSGAQFQRYRYNDIDHLRQKLQQHGEKANRRLIIVDGVFSMSGTIVDAEPIVALCREFDAALMVDECHSHFVLGDTGGGIKEYFGLHADDITIEMGTLSKAIPSDGGYVAASSDLCNFLRREARAFIYSGSTSPVMTAVSIAALKIFQQERTDLVSKLSKNAQVFRSELRKHGVSTPDSPTPIVPIHVGPAEAAAAAATYCQKHGIFIHPVFPPVVPAGKSILRASIMASHDEADLRSAAAIIADAVHQSLDQYQHATTVAKTAVKKQQEKPVPLDID
jgi:8-amino-7-oxononanoate synthase